MNDAEVFESTFAVAKSALIPDVLEAQRISHDAVIASTGRARRSGVTWLVRPLLEWRAVFESLGIEVDENRPRPPTDVEVLAAQYPAGLLVVATVLVDPEVEP